MSVDHAKLSLYRLCSGFPNGTIGNFTNGTIGLPLGEPMVPGIGMTIGTNCFTNGTIGRTLNDFGIPVVPLVEP